MALFIFLNHACVPQADIDDGLAMASQLLLEAGAVTTAKDANGKTPVDVAIDDDLVEALGGPQEDEAAAAAAKPAAGKKK